MAPLCRRAHCCLLRLQFGRKALAAIEVLQETQRVLRDRRRKSQGAPLGRVSDQSECRRLLATERARGYGGTALVQIPSANHQPRTRYSVLKQSDARVAHQSRCLRLSASDQTSEE